MLHFIAMMSCTWCFCAPGNRLDLVTDVCADQGLTAPCPAHVNASVARMEVATLDSLQLTAWVGSREALLELILEAKRFNQVQLPECPSLCCNHT